MMISAKFHLATFQLIEVILKTQVDAKPSLKTQVSVLAFNIQTTLGNTGRCVGQVSTKHEMG